VVLRRSHVIGLVVHTIIFGLIVRFFVVVMTLSEMAKSVREDRRTRDDVVDEEG